MKRSVSARFLSWFHNAQKHLWGRFTSFIYFLLFKVSLNRSICPIPRQKDSSIVSKCILYCFPSSNIIIANNHSASDYHLHPRLLNEFAYANKDVCSTSHWDHHWAGLTSNKTKVTEFTLSNHCGSCSSVQHNFDGHTSFHQHFLVTWPQKVQRKFPFFLAILYDYHLSTLEAM